LKKLALILGNQLFPIENQLISNEIPIFMCEDLAIYQGIKNHKSKIALGIFAMRSYRDLLSRNGYKINYIDSSKILNNKFINLLKQHLLDKEISHLIFYEIEDKPLEEDVIALANELSITIEVLKSPMFLDTRNDFCEYSKNKKTLLQGNYYKQNRKRLNILIEDNKPVGGKWSFDEMNRLKLPKDYDVPELPSIDDHQDKEEVFSFISTNYSNHQGELNVLTPYTHEQADNWLKVFFNERFNDFGPYEDALVENKHFLLHSVLSSSLNLGLLTPKDVINKALVFANDNNIQLNSLEGFIRQIIGWREFIRGIYQNFSSKMIQRNFWKHKRKMKDSWYEGNTGIPPLDDAIKATTNYGYTHHINRLMVLSNLMNLCGIHPDIIYKWFMEMFIDSAEWVMVPNVYGMGTFSDGGVFATKPYICGSSYMLRMSNFKKGDWCDVVDGLYWQFIENNREFFNSNPRLSLMTRSLDKMDKERKNKIFASANEFIQINTYE